ncbi:alkyl sulfatase dimerization domain-containing protein [Catenulispora pinisilvae]|uniref:alkyl sulfatase dimerization domain-containing protein n=1 Tax=Catenulispora pinisilvae TaxID=2705253 RepID=UPI001892617C|nr:alkyl sulfatase dimerization domain-containing protein [Catenulispora pinisilvae]
MDTLRDFAEQMWQGRGVMRGLMPEGAPTARAFALTGQIAVVPDFANITAFATDDGLVLVDTGLELTAQSMYDAIRAWSDQPVRYAVFTHGHVDHVFGLGPFDAEAEAAGRPKPVVVAHEAVADRFDRYATTAGYNAVINSRQFGVDDLAWPTTYRRPDRVYRDHFVLEHGGLTFELHHALGETDDHTWVHVPELGALCPGDLFVWVSPNAGNPQKVQRYPAEWAQALRTMAEVGAELLLPSHGPPIFGADRVREALTCTAEYLEALIEQTLGLMNAGRRLDEIIHTVRPPDHLTSKPYLQPVYDEPEFIVRTIWRRYGGWYDGNPAHLKPAPEEQLAKVIAQLAGGAERLATRAHAAADDGDLRLATDLVELAWQAAPDDVAIHKSRAEIYEARTEGERSLMAQGIYRWAARESRRATE